MQKIWQIRDSNPKLQVALSNELGIHPIVAQVLINRGITTAKEANLFLNSKFSDLHDPFLLKDMKKIVERLKQAKEKKEKVLVFGDYDVDGITSSALMNNILSALKIDFIHHIPHRLNDGYGLNHEIGQFAKDNGVSLFITVDCGITSFSEIEHFNELGMDVIVIDHHEPLGDKLPNTYAIIDPKIKDCKYPFKHLASVGLVAKLAQAIFGKLDEETLHLAALGIVADVVPLIGENRIFVKAGLPTIHKTKNKGLLALLEVGGIKGKKVNPFHIGFIIGPRINAAGRMDSAQKSLDLFLSKDAEEAYHIAKVLDRHNSIRQKMQNEIAQEAIAIIEQTVNFKDEKVIVIAKEGWHQGVMGIVASKITEKYYRPAIVISLKEGKGVGSARSIEGFNLHAALESCSDCLEDFGGHEGAAGVTIKEENLGDFRSAINRFANDTLEIMKLTPRIEIDCEIPLNQINIKLAEIINTMEPFGEGNPNPVFCSRGVTVKSYPQLMGRDTLKFWVNDGNVAISAVGFGMASYQGMVAPGEKIDLVYQIIIDEWNKEPTAQLKLKDIRISDAG